MANYYRVNLKDKAGNIIYPNIHNLISIDKTTGGITLSQGGITLSNGKLISKGLSLRGGHLYLEGTYGAVLDNTTKIVFGTPESNYANITANNGGAIGFYASLTDKTNGFFWNPGQKAISPENNNQLSCGMSDKRWTNVYSVNGNFSGPITSSVTTNTHLAGNKGENVIINSTNTTTDAYVILARFKSNNGVFTMGRWGDSFHLFYTAQSIIDAGTNSTSKNLSLLDESGNSVFPGTITANALTLNGNMTLNNSATSWRGIKGVMGDNDQWYIGGKADAADSGYMLIATGDGGNEPIYVRQFSSGGPPSGTVTRTLTLLDGSGNTTLPGHLLMTAGKYIRLNTNSSSKVTLTSGCGISSGGDQADAADANIRIFSWYGVGFTPTISGQTIPQGENAVYINCRTGALTARGTVTGTKFSGQLNKKDTFYNAGTQGISYYDADFTTTSASTNGWTAPSAAWYQVLHLDLSVDNYYNDLYFPVNSRECLFWRQRCNSGYYGFYSIPSSHDRTVKNLRAGAKATWDSNYSGYTNGTVMFCW